MIQTLAIDQATLYDLEQRFGLVRSDDPDFFQEWRQNLPDLTAIEQERLRRIQAAYANLERRSVLENTVKLAVVAPLLDLASFFLPPFYVDTETSVEIVADLPDAIDEMSQIGQNVSGQKLRGRIDILVLLGQLWVLAIESKRSEFSLKVGIPQVLAYMLAAPKTNHGRYGLVTNGSSFLFVKLRPITLNQASTLGPSEATAWRYDKSPEFILDRADDLACVLQIMKALGSIAIANHNQRSIARN